MSVMMPFVVNVFPPWLRVQDLSRPTAMQTARGLNQRRVICHGHELSQGKAPIYSGPMLNIDQAFYIGEIYVKSYKLMHDWSLF